MNKNCTVFERTTPNERNVFCERKKWMEFVIVEQNGYFHGYDEKIDSLECVKRTYKCFQIILLSTVCSQSSAWTLRIFFLAGHFQELGQRHSIKTSDLKINHTTIKKKKITDSKLAKMIEFVWKMMNFKSFHRQPP